MIKNFQEFKHYLKRYVYREYWDVVKEEEESLSFQNEHTQNIRTFTFSHDLTKEIKKVDAHAFVYLNETKTEKGEIDMEWIGFFFYEEKADINVSYRDNQLYYFYAYAGDLGYERIEEGLDGEKKEQVGKIIKKLPKYRLIALTND